MNRKAMLRRGPGSYHAVIAAVEAGNEFDILGKDFNGLWWQVEYEGSLAGILTSYVDATNTSQIQIVATPTSLPSPTYAPTPTQTPTPTPEQVSVEDWKLIRESVKNDILGSGNYLYNYDNPTLDKFTSELLLMLRKASEICDMPIARIIKSVEEYAAPVDRLGISAQNSFWVRYAYITALSELEYNSAYPQIADGR